MRVQAFLALASTLLLGGCVADPLGQALDGRSRLDTFTKCDFLYPDAQPINCSMDQDAPAEREVPTGWRCTHTTRGEIAHVEVWASGDGRAGLLWDFKWPDYVGVVGLVRAGGGERLVQGPMRGFARFDETWQSGDSIPIRFEFRPFSAWSDHPALGNDTLDPATTLFNDRLWTVWRFSDGEISYNFLSVVSFTTGHKTEYYPADVHNVSGADFNLTILSGNWDGAMSMVIPSELDWLLLEVQPRCQRD